MADVALRAGLFTHPADLPAIVVHLFSAVVLMALVTTIVTPVALNLLVRPPAGAADRKGSASRARIG